MTLMANFSNDENNRLSKYLVRYKKGQNANAGRKRLRRHIIFACVSVALAIIARTLKGFRMRIVPLLVLTFLAFAALALVGND